MSSSRPIVVLGPNGMLGQMVVAYFTQRGYKVIPLSGRFEEETKWDFLNSILFYTDAAIFNCIGRIKQKTVDEKDLLWANTILPLTLSRYLLPTQTVIHPSTDCVFDGLAGRPYTISDNTNSRDSYGWSKILGEEVLLKRPNTFITRVSIVGPDKNKFAKGLLGWFLSNPKGSQLNGYTNHLWNGITTLEWCKQIEKMVINESLVNSTHAKLVQFSTAEHYSKHEMLCMFNEIYKRNNIILPCKAEQAVDRRLMGQIICPPLKLQMEELKSKFNDQIDD